MTDDHSHENMVPPAALKAAIGLVAFSLLLVAGVRVAAITPAASPPQLRAEAQLRPLTERRLRFSDTALGEVLVVDAASGRQVAVIGQEGGGFIRGVMRGLARERRQHQKGPSAPFRLSSWPDGGLTLTDEATGRVIELGSFGPSNRAAFAKFLTDGRKAS